jgi:hypothetical protein
MLGASRSVLDADRQAPDSVCPCGPSVGGGRIVRDG